MSVPKWRASSRRERRASSRGVALVEFALLLPFLLIVVLGVVDGARALFVWVEIKNATREGAVYGQSHPHSWRSDAVDDPCDDGDSIVGHVDAETDLPVTVTIRYRVGSNFNGNLSPDECRAAATAPVTGGTDLRVHVSTPFNAVTPLMNRFFDTVTATVITKAQG